MNGEQSKDRSIQWIDGTLTISRRLIDFNVEGTARILQSKRIDHLETPVDSFVVLSEEIFQNR